MRSQQVYQALVHVPNRFALCRLTSVALKKLHRSHSRPEDTINDVLRDIDRYKSRRPRTAQNVGSSKPVADPSLKDAVELGSQPQVEVSASSDLVFVGY